jgi:hypothetical protein
MRVKPAPGGAARLRREIWPRRDPCRPGFIALTGPDLPIGQWDGRLRKPKRQADYLAVPDQELRSHDHRRSMPLCPHLAELVSQ